VTRTVALVVVGAGCDAIAAAIAVARRGQRALILLGPRDRARVGRVRWRVRAAGAAVRRRITVMTGSELVCADGIGGVEAVVVRRVGSGRLQAFNTRAVAGHPRGSPPRAGRPDRRPDVSQAGGRGGRVTASRNTVSSPDRPGRRPARSSRQTRR